MSDPVKPATDAEIAAIVVACDQEVRFPGETSWLDGVRSLLARIDADAERLRDLEAQVTEQREFVRRVASESCGAPDERHCTCVAPLRERLRDLETQAAAMREALSKMSEAKMTERDLLRHPDANALRMALMAATALPPVNGRCQRCRGTGRVTLPPPTEIAAGALVALPVYLDQDCPECRGNGTFMHRTPAPGKEKP